MPLIQVWLFSLTSFSGPTPRKPTPLAPLPSLSPEHVRVAQFLFVPGKSWGDVVPLRPAILPQNFAFLHPQNLPVVHSYLLRRVYRNNHSWSWPWKRRVDLVSLPITRLHTLQAAQIYGRKDQAIRVKIIARRIIACSSCSCFKEQQCPVI